MNSETTGRQRVTPQAGKDYVIRSPAPAERVDVEVWGAFQGRPVRWQVELMTLRAYHGLCVQRGRQTESVRPFLDVGEAEGDTRPIRVGLDVPIIDQATVIKAVIMILKYKRLHVGRHEYGEARRF